MSICTFDPYIFSKLQDFKPMKTILTGSDSSGARFGTAMASLGDMNVDGFNGKSDKI